MSQAGISQHGPQPTPMSYTTLFRKPGTLYEIAIERIGAVYSHETAKKEGIGYWPDPLPTPSKLLPDPLVLFHPEEALRREAEAEYQQEYSAIVPMPVQEVLERRSRENTKPSMQIPLGLIDKPEEQQRETFLVDLHGSTGPLTGGPLLIVGAQHSGKATALQTLLFWLTSRFLPEQLRCAIVDPLTELDAFQTLPHFRSSQGEPLWTGGTTDEQIMRFIKTVSAEIQQRQSAVPNQHWDNLTFSHLWSRGYAIPQLLLIICNYHTFADRPTAHTALTKLAQSFIETRAMGTYLVITSAETGTRSVPDEIASKCSTKIGLFLNDQQRSELFGYAAPQPETIPGRGLLLTPERKVYQIQLALPIAGKNESVRKERLKVALASAMV